MSCDIVTSDFCTKKIPMMAGAVEGPTIAGGEETSPSRTVRRDFGAPSTSTSWFEASLPTILDGTTIWGWTSIPLTTPPALTLDPTQFQRAAEMYSAISYYESTVSNAPAFTAFGRLARSAGITPTNGIALASNYISAFPGQPTWFPQAPPPLQTYVLSIANNLQSLYVDDPQATGDASYDPDSMASVAAIWNALHNFEATVTNEPSYSDFAELAATATGLDHVEPSREPLALAKALERGPTPSWYAQMPAALQTYVRDIAMAEQQIFDNGGPVAGGPGSAEPSGVSGSGAVRNVAGGSGAVTLAMFLLVVAFL